MANFARYIQDSEAIDYTPASAVSAGQVVVLADLIGVAKLDIAANVLGALHIRGIFDFPKSTAGGSAIAVGTTVYWNTDSYVAQATASTYKQLGKVVKAAVDADTTVRVALNGPQPPATAHTPAAPPR